MKAFVNLGQKLSKYEELISGGFDIRRKHVELFQIILCPPTLGGRALSKRSRA